MMHFLMMNVCRKFVQNPYPKVSKKMRKSARDRNDADACVASIQTTHASTHAWPCVVPVYNFLFHSDRVGNA